MIFNIQKIFSNIKKHFLQLEIHQFLILENEKKEIDFLI